MNNEDAGFKMLESFLGEEDAQRFAEALGTLEQILAARKIQSFALFVSTPNPQLPGLRFVNGNAFATQGMVTDYLDELKGGKVASQIGNVMDARERGAKLVTPFTRNGNIRGLG